MYVWFWGVSGRGGEGRDLAARGGDGETGTAAGSRVVQPPVRNAGADGLGGSEDDETFCQPEVGGGGGASEGGDGGCGVGGAGAPDRGVGVGLVVGGKGPLTVDHPDCLKPWPAAELEAESETQPLDLFDAVVSADADGSIIAAVAVLVVAVVAAPVTAGLDILTPLAAAILRSSFSSLFRSFSFRLPTSSFGTMRALACMSFSRALW